MRLIIATPRLADCASHPGNVHPLLALRRSCGLCGIGAWSVTDTPDTPGKVAWAAAQRRRRGGAERRCRGTRARWLSVGRPRAELAATARSFAARLRRRRGCWLDWAEGQAEAGGSGHYTAGRGPLRSDPAVHGRLVLGLGPVYRSRRAPRDSLSLSGVCVVACESYTATSLIISTN